MTRVVGLAKLASVLLLTATLAACERSATAPIASTVAPRLDGVGLNRGTKLEAPEHKGGLVSGTIGKRGGHLEFHDRSARGIDYVLDVPSGVLHDRTAITMQVLGDSDYDVELTAVAGTEDVGAKGFKQPVRLTISYATAKHPAPPPHLLIANVLPDGTLVPVKTQVNPGQKTITGYLPHFSNWTIAIW